MHAGKCNNKKMEMYAQIKRGKAKEQKVVKHQTTKEVHVHVHILSILNHAQKPRRSYPVGVQHIQVVLN